MKAKRHYRAAVTAESKSSSASRHTELDLGTTTYLTALNKAHELCRSTLDPREKYKIKIIRDDGHEYSETGWYVFTGRSSRPI